MDLLFEQDPQLGAQVAGNPYENEGSIFRVFEGFITKSEITISTYFF